MLPKWEVADALTREAETQSQCERHRARLRPLEPDQHRITRKPCECPLRLNGSERICFVGNRYSNVYRVKELDKAHGLAERIAKDRKLPIKTQEPPVTAKPEAPTPQLDVGDLHDLTPGEAAEYDFDNGVTPF